MKNLPAQAQSDELGDLFKLPPEVRHRIWEYAVKHDGYIKPNQWTRRSNKFGQNGVGTTYHPRTNSTPAFTIWNPARIDGRLPKALTAIDLVRTCRRIYKEVSTEFLFYKVNDFEFNMLENLLAFLVALKPERRNAITSIMFQAAYNRRRIITSAMTLLGACSGLKHLSMDITTGAYYFNPGVSNFTDTPGYQQLLELRGLKTFVMSYGKDDKYWNLPMKILETVRHVPVSEEAIAGVKAEIQQVEEDINKIVTLPGPSLLNKKRLWNAMRTADLAQWGDGTYLPNRKEIIRENQKKKEELQRANPDAGSPSDWKERFGYPVNFGTVEYWEHDYPW